MTAETHADPAEKLIHMAGQIADFYAAYPATEAAASVAKHINQFWTPKMREQFLDATAQAGAELHPLLQEARTQIKRRKISA